MKKRIKTLSLHRETLRHLSVAQDGLLEKAQGGSLTYGGYCTAYCSGSCGGGCEYTTHTGGTDCCQ